MTAGGSCPEAGASESCDQHWLDALSDAALILGPVHGGRKRIVGFRVERVNDAAAQLGAATGADRLGVGSVIARDLLGLEHESASRLLSLFRAVLKTGTAGDLDGLAFESTAGRQATRHVRDVHV